MKAIKELAPFIVGICIITGIAYCSWRIERWFHYKYSYSNQVQEQIQPLVNRIDALEKRIEQLEKK
jgi:predicted PurR-regulated permease PerM